MKKIFYISIIIIVLGICSLLFTNNKTYAYTSEEYTQKLNESVAYAMSLIDDEMTDHEKAYIFAQYCQEGNIYGSSGKDQLVEGVLVDHKAVCAGYASTFRLLCTTAGIPCETLVSNSAAHAWNICYLDGEWTYVDVTRGPSGKYKPQDFDGNLFVTKNQFDFVTARKPDGSTIYTSGDMAEENGWEIIESRYFDDAYYTYGGINRNYYPAGVEDYGEFDSTLSRMYYDEDYKYYEERETLATTSKIYKENRVTGEKTKMADALSYGSTITGIVKDENKIYYIGTDGAIYSMDLNGNNKTKEFTYSGTESIGGIFVQDGYICYALRTSETSTSAEFVQWKKMETAITTGEYTVNNSESKYVLNYIKTTNGVVISYCEGIGNSEPSGKLYIPDTIDGLPVIGIGEDAFYDLELTGELKLPKNLKYIGEDAFRNTNISSVVFNSELETIGYYAFGGCESLTGTLNMSDSIKYIDYRAFYNCNYEKINFSDNLVMISGYAFYGNENLNGVVVIPEGVITIGNSAFYNTSLEAAILPETLINLGQYAFEHTYSRDDEITDIAIKSEQMKSFYESDEYTIYLMPGTETSEYADDNNIAYENLSTAKPNIQFKETNIEINLADGDKQLEYTITPGFFDGYSKTWSSSNSNIVSVNNGTITPKKEGNATIYLSVNGTRVGCPVNVVEKQLVLGDVNGDGKASPYDALLINKMFEEMETPTEEQLAAGDIDGNGMLTPYDALMINLAFEEFRPVERVDR